MDIRKCFKILELSPDVTVRELNEAYKDLVSVWHPDRFPNNPRLRKKAEEKLKLLNDAYDNILNYLRTGQHGDEKKSAIITPAPEKYPAEREVNPPKPSSERQYNKDVPARPAPQKKVKPGVRALSRFLDYLLFAVILKILGLDRIFSEIWFIVLYPVMLTLLWVIPESIYLNLFGTTPGKWLMKISINDLFQLKPKFSDALKRSLSVWCNGMGMGVPFITPFTAVITLIKIRTKGNTAWDRDSGFFVKHKNISMRRFLPVLLVSFLMCVFLFLDQDIMVEAWQQIVLIKPDNPDNHYKLGSLYYKIGRYEDAVEAYKKAIHIKPEYAQAHYFLGKSYSILNQPKAAITAFKTAAALSPDNFNIFYDLGICSKRLGLTEDAIKAFKHTLTITPDHGEAQYHLGLCYFQLHQYHDAIPNFQAALSILPDSVDIFYHLGICFFKTRNVETAIINFQKTIQLKNDHSAAFYNLGKCYFEQGLYLDAVKPLQKAVSLKPDNPRFLYSLGICYAKIRSTQKALETLEKAIKIKSDDARAYHILGLTYLTVGDKKSAVTQYEVLKTLDTILAEELKSFIDQMPDT